MNDQPDQEDWYLHRLWRHAKNRGFNIRIEDDQIRLVLGLQWNAIPARSFPWNSEGIKAAWAWIDDPTTDKHQPPAQATTQPTSIYHSAASGAASGVGRVIGWVVGFVVASAIIGGIASWWNNNHYNSTFESNFLASCENNGGSPSACSCSYNVLQQQYSYSQAKYFDANPNAPDSQSALSAISSQCK
jgi:hypothetical protein